MLLQKTNRNIVLLIGFICLLFGNNVVWAGEGYNFGNKKIVCEVGDLIFFGPLGDNVESPGHVVIYAGQEKIDDEWVHKEKRGQVLNYKVFSETISRSTSVPLGSVCLRL